MLVEPLRAELAQHDGPTIVCAQAGEINTGAFDPLAEICQLARGRGRVDPRRRSVRALGGRVARASPPSRRARRSGLLGRRRAQVAQRPLRQRDGVRPRRRGAPRHHREDLAVYGQRRCRRPRELRVRAGNLTTRPRVHRLRGPALPWEIGGRRARRPQLRPGPPVRRSARRRAGDRSATTSSSTR
jgi:hypothetical protein